MTVRTISSSKDQNVCAHPEVKSLNFEFEIDFVSNQYEMIQTKEHTIEQ